MRQPYKYSLLILAIIIACYRSPASAEQMAKEWKEPFTGMVFVWVPAGTFKMGCGSWTTDCEDDEKPVHDVRLKGFWIGKYEITQAQWKIIMGNNPSRFPKSGVHPVEMVSWDDAKEFITKLNSMGGTTYRLPTEAEWEYAARSGGKPEKFAGGKNVDQVAWYIENSETSTHPVGTKAPNGLGIYDMTGNVWEWVEDAMGKYPSSLQENPVVHDGNPHRVFRGGSWSYSASELRTSGRGEYYPDGRSSNLGFRLVKE